MVASAGMQAPTDSPAICQACPSQFLLGNCAEFFLYCLVGGGSSSICLTSTTSRFVGACGLPASPVLPPPPPSPMLPGPLPAAVLETPEVCARCTADFFLTQCKLFYEGCLSPFRGSAAGCQKLTTDTYAIKCPGAR
ncbi:hypothetical protein WJX84_004142 [Apatococcus fuscideae]|uniref:Uncharacterized protein n=1 Tax=Apatococcus fuscideae TaxID=2026836 RepID=A0AAW1TDT9_9CHLO